MEDAYGTVQDKRFQDELQKIYCEIKKLRDLLPSNPTKENVLQCLPIYEDAVEGITSLISFSYCASSADITDSAAASAYAQTQALYAELESIASPLFAKLGSIADNDPFWENAILIGNLTLVKRISPGVRVWIQPQTRSLTNLPQRVFIL